MLCSVHLHECLNKVKIVVAFITSDYAGIVEITANSGYYNTSANSFFNNI
jgi:hypothetical protein